MMDLRAALVEDFLAELNDPMHKLVRAACRCVRQMRRGQRVETADAAEQAIALSHVLTEWSAMGVSLADLWSPIEQGDPKNYVSVRRIIEGGERFGRFYHDSLERCDGTDAAWDAAVERMLDEWKDVEV